MDNREILLSPIKIGKHDCRIAFLSRQWNAPMQMRMAIQPI